MNNKNDKKFNIRLSHMRMNNRGTTMVELLVSFVVLMIVLAALFGMVRFSSNLRMRAVDTANVRESFNKEIYKKTPDPTIVATYQYEGKSKDGKTAFMLTLSDDTDVSNLEIGSSERAKFQKNLRVPSIDAVGYKSLDSRITDENLATPKALTFYYHHTR